jgi:hypothetical protein
MSTPGFKPQSAADDKEQGRTPPPKYLYKYRSVDADALAMLAADKVYMSRIGAFNDPFEALDLETESLVHNRRRHRHHDPYAASLRVCALSEEHRDLLMWGHYGDRHRGFCIRFEFDKDPELCKSLFPVEYEPTIPARPIEVRDALEMAKRNSLIKSDKWSYEKEWRIIGNVADNEAETAELFLEYNPAALSAIIFGVRTPDLHKTLIRQLLSDRSVEFKQAVKQEDDFALSIQDDVPNGPEE